MCNSSNMKLCVKRSHLHEAIGWLGRAAYLSGGGLSGGGAESWWRAASEGMVSQRLIMLAYACGAAAI